MSIDHIPDDRDAETLADVEKSIEAKIAQLEHYRDNDCQLDHARTIADGRILQARMDLNLVAKALRSAALPKQADPSREELLQLIRSTFNEGFNEGTREHTTHGGGKTWAESRALKTFIKLTESLAAKPAEDGVRDLLSGVVISLRQIEAWLWRERYIVIADQLSTAIDSLSPPSPGERK